FKLIYNLVKERGFTLEGAKQKLKKNPLGTINNYEIVSRLEFVKAELIKIKNQL
ncbi:transcriptional regulator, partial [Flavobacteriaceae bacterium]|nr:transcriptional regulator [Flavobacteriaceae bacterium]